MEKVREENCVALLCEQALVDLERKHANRGMLFLLLSQRRKWNLRKSQESAEVRANSKSSSSILEVEPSVTAEGTGSGIETIEERTGFGAIVSGGARESASSIDDEADEGSTMLVAIIS